MQKVVYIVGPTAVGKTDLSISLAQKFNGELISADSVQVFKGLDIISGKDIPKDGTIRIHLLDVVDPTENFSINDFYQLASEFREKIENDSKLPIVVGGTGLYIQTLINGLSTNGVPNFELRQNLERLSIEELQKKVPVEKLLSMNESDKKNKRRLIRAIEIFIQPPSTNHQSHRIFDNLVIGLTCDREVLKSRIDTRVEKRLKEGALEEAKSLFENYEKLSQQVKDANGYKQLFSFLKSEIDLDEAIYRWKISEYRHAKNQMTWFRKYGNVEWFDTEATDFKKQIEERTEEFL